MGQKNNQRDNEQKFSKVTKKHQVRNAVNFKWGKYQESHI